MTRDSSAMCTRHPLHPLQLALYIGRIQERKVTFKTCFQGCMMKMQSQIQKMLMTSPRYKTLSRTYCHLSLFVCLSLFPSLSLSHCIISWSVSLSPSRSIPLCLSLYLCLSVSLSPSLSLLPLSAGMRSAAHYQQPSSLKLLNVTTTSCNDLGKETWICQGKTELFNLESKCSVCFRRICYST